ncbi:MAG: GTPase HflX [Dehalococcoidales bacterium]
MVAVTTRNSTGTKWPIEDSIEELAQLTTTAGADIVGRITQQLPVPSKAYYLGKGKLDELLSLQDSLDYTMVVFDDELTPLQQRNLERILKVKVIDRSALILDIFSKRAQTREGQLQVELAQHQYLLPRLAGQWSHLERLGGGIGTRGPGESQLETDRRLVNRKVHHLKKQIEAVKKHRSLYRQQRRRQGIPIIALVGYTNAGKSTILNALTQADVVIEDKLFATLDPKTRSFVLPSNEKVLFTDTVGFIQKLPPSIVSAFRATLEELSEASILLHIVDLTSPNAAEQCQTVEDILRDMELSRTPVITVLNKIDLLLSREKNWDERSAMEYLSEQVPAGGKNTVLVSATRKWGLDDLIALIQNILNQNTR